MADAADTGTLVNFCYEGNPNTATMNCPPGGFNECTENADCLDPDYDAESQSNMKCFLATAEQTTLTWATPCADPVNVHVNFELTAAGTEAAALALITELIAQSTDPDSTLMQSATAGAILQVAEIQDDLQLFTCEPVFLGPDIGFANIMEYHDDDGTCSPRRHCHSTLLLTAIDCHCLGIYIVILLSLRILSVKMTVSPRARHVHHQHERARHDVQRLLSGPPGAFKRP